MSEEERRQTIEDIKLSRTHGFLLGLYVGTACGIAATVFSIFVLPLLRAAR